MTQSLNKTEGYAYPSISSDSNRNLTLSGSILQICIGPKALFLSTIFSLQNFNILETYIKKMNFNTEKAREKEEPRSIYQSLHPSHCTMRSSGL